jgi:hypothetical protein
MAGPFVFIGTHTFKEGKLEDFKRDSRALAQLVKEKEPRVLSFAFYFNEDETEASVVQVHPDADSMVNHMQVVREHIMQSSEEQLVTKDIQIFGTPNGLVLGMIKELSQSGVPLTVKPNHHAGFIASNPKP